MKFYSEITKSFYDSVESCEEAEKEYNKALDEKKEKEKTLKAERKARAEELSDAYKTATWILYSTPSDFSFFDFRL